MFPRLFTRTRRKLIRREDLGKNCVLFLFCILILTVLYTIGFIDHFLEVDFSEFRWPPYIDVHEQVVKELTGEKPQYMYLNKWDDFETVLSPSCSGNRLTRRKSLLILVKSSPNRLQNRDAIRATWGKKIQHESWRIRTAFVMGQMRDHEIGLYGDILQAEQKQFGDLLVGEFIDHYRNNTFKFLHSIKYAKNYCNSETLPYVLLVDDDYLLSIKNLCTELDKHPPNERLYMGWRFDTSPFRLIFHKHRVSLTAYPYNRFPPYISAGAVLLTPQTITEFYLAAQYSKIFPFDDIYTGILAYQLGISAQHNENFQFWFSYLDENSSKKVIAAHGYSPKDLVKIYPEFDP